MMLNNLSNAKLLNTNRKRHYHTASKREFDKIFSLQLLVHFFVYLKYKNLQCHTTQSLHPTAVLN